jgi:hypothetical protein
MQIIGKTVHAGMTFIHIYSRRRGHAGARERDYSRHAGRDPGLGNDLIALG